ncbi:N-acetyltransferase family protein [Actinospongicola halichondriae]|uniref:GNAT family N-acetyltransferase n=1 Tax=Actinospongicola halichondriae TaxID=3236844 RepID=UPI003D3FB393
MPSDPESEVVTIRPATIDDAEATAAIYNVEVTGSDVTFDLVPRSVEDQRAWLGERSGALEVIVAEVEGRIAGFASLSTYRERAAYRGTVEDSVYVATDARGRGVGRVLLHGIVDVATARGFHTVMARIVGGHDASIALHRGAGFDHVGVEREVGRKFGRWLDVVVMQKLL